MRVFEPSELIVTSEGALYHIGLRPEHVKDNVILVGDPSRVELVASFFDLVSFETSNREFRSIVGRFNGQEITVLSTGIGTDNIDIALNELDAAVNIDLEKKQTKAQLRSLNLIRLGTSGALQEDLAVNSVIASKYGLGFDGLMNYYKIDYSAEEKSIRDAFIYHTTYPMQLAKPYIIGGNQDLRLRVAPDKQAGITATASGFYAPQGRELRAEIAFPNLNSLFSSFDYHGTYVTNYEMETSALFGLSRVLGHKATTLCAIIANRIRKEYSKDYKKTVKEMVAEVLERLTQK